MKQLILSAYQPDSRLLISIYEIKKIEQNADYALDFIENISPSYSQFS